MREGRGQEAMLQACTLGALQIEPDGQPVRFAGRKTRSLLAYLLIHCNASIPRDVLAGTFWPDSPDARARRALSHALWQIRSAHPALAARLVAGQDEVSFRLLPGDRLDVAEFERKAQAEPSSLPDLTAAVALYRGDFLEGCYDDWALLERERLRQLYLETLERLIGMHKLHGNFEGALACAQRLVAADPLRESTHQELMRLYHALDRDRDALEQHAALRRILTDEIGVEPLPATDALAREIAARLDENETPYLPLKAGPALALEQPERIPLVGRREERAALLAHLDAALGGRGGLVLLEGEAGVGKTRLMQQVARDAEWRGVQVHWGKAWELAETPPYGLLHQLLRSAISPLRASQLAQIVEGAWLREVSRLLPDLVEWLPELPPAVNVDLPPEQQRQRLHQALTYTVLALGAIVPHMLILEDVQWADSSTLAALAHLSGQLPHAHLLLVVTCRDAEARQTPVVWEALQALSRATDCEWLRLARLGAAETGQIVQYALGLAHHDASLERQVYDETDGNPLFVIETLRALRDEGLLRRDETGTWRAMWDETAAGATGLPLPAGICRVIERRLAQLEEPARATLGVAAVLGSRFDFTLLVQTGSLAPGHALRAMRELLWEQFLTEEPDAYSFGHDKIREVVYRQLPAAERRRLHCQAGQALERLQPEQVEKLAHHFALGEVWDKSLAYNLQAGRRARAVYAGTEAMAHLGRALDAWQRLQPPDPGVGLSIYEERGRLCQETGRFDQAEADLRAGCELAERAGDQASHARILNRLSYLAFQRGDYDRAIVLARQVVDLATAAGAIGEVAAGLFRQANAVRNQGRYQASLPLYEQAAALFEELDEPARLADCLNRMGGALYRIGNPVRGQSVVKRSLAIRRRLGDKVGISYSLINLAALCYYLGQYSQARDAAQEALEIATAIGDPYGQDAALGNLGTVLADLGALTEAIACYQRALEIGRQIGDRPIESDTLYELGKALFRLGDLPRAQEALEEALELGRAGVESRLMPEIHATLALVLLSQEQTDRAVVHAEAALETAREIGTPWVLGIVHRVAGTVASRAGSRWPNAEAAAHLEESASLLRQVGAEGELARSLAAWGLHLQGSAQAEDVRRGAEMLEQAAALFEKLGMAWDLARLEQERAPYRLPRRVEVRLPVATAPTGRPLREDETVPVIWTVDAAEDAAVKGAVGRRRQRLLRLLRQAAEQGAAPTVPDLAQALGAGERTIERDLAALRAAGHAVHTRGRRRAS